MSSTYVHPQGAIPISLGKFALRLGLLLVLTAAVAAGLLLIYRPHELGVGLLALGICGLITLAGYWVTQRALTGSPGKFMQALVGSTMLKLVAGAGALAVLLAFFPLERWTVVSCFFGAYVVCTALEVTTLLHNLRAVSTPQTPAA